MLKKQWKNHTVIRLPALSDLNATNKRVLVRLDLNLPLLSGKITDFTRLHRSLPTVQDLINRKARVILLAHLGRPDGADERFSLAPIAQALKEALAPTPVFFCEKTQGPEVQQAIHALHPGQVLLIENIRFTEGEEKNDPVFAEEIASWGDAYVNDAFSAAHRAHASTEGVAHLLPKYAGHLMKTEIETLTHILEAPQHPFMALVGGAKISTKLPLLAKLIPQVDVLVVGGAMATTFLVAQGVNVGASLYEPEFLPMAHSLLKRAPSLLLPRDVTVAPDLKDSSYHAVRQLNEIQPFDKIFDIGPETCEIILERLSKCRTLLWNGPLGVFEVPPFDQGTIRIAQGAAQLTREGKLTSVAGGGDTLPALSHAHVLEDFSYVSTAGGAFLEWLEGKSLPGIAALLAPYA